MAVLRDGATPLLGGTTAANEAALGIAPPCVYTYLGQTFEEFGECGLSLPMDALAAEATVSPFDTGGLVKHLEPVKDWAADAKQAYLAHFSWPVADLEELLAYYPTGDADRVRRYLAGDPPSHAGPHEAFPPDVPEETRVAAIWQNGTKTQAWLWEARTPHRLEVGPRLYRWSCSPPMYAAILEYVEGLPEGDDAEWMVPLIERYVPGGVSTLVAELIPAQEAA